jgi:hypothetical protein
MLEMTHSLDDTLDEALDAAMEKLRPHATFFQQFRDDGGTINFFIGIFGPKNFGLVFPPALLSEIAALGIELGLDIYPGAPTD